MIHEIETTDVVVRDGSTVCVRRTTRDDLDALSQFFHSLSSESRYYRFLGIPALTETRLRALAATDDNSAGISLVVESAGRIVAFAGFYRDPHRAERAEVAFAVSDALQGHGIGTRLLEQLARIARDQGLSTFEAYVAPGNRRMLEVFRDSGFAVTTRVQDGVVHLLISLSLTRRFEDRAAARSRTAATASMKAFFEPRVVAVVGASRQRGKIGSEILHNLVTAGFTGTIVPVHPTASAIEGRSARSPATSDARSRLWRSRRDGRPPAAARPPRTPARWPPAIPWSMRSSGRPASSGPSGWRNCSTWPRCCRTNRCPVATGSRS